MGHTSSAEGRNSWQCCKSSAPSADRAQDTIRIKDVDVADGGSVERLNYGCASCSSLIKSTRADSMRLSAPLDCEPLSRLSVVVTNVTPTGAAIRWSCSTATAIHKFFIEVLFGDAVSSFVSFTVDGKADSFEIPAGTLRRAHGPYFVKVVAEAHSDEAPIIPNIIGVSAAFFTEADVPSAVTQTSGALYGHPAFVEIREVASSMTPLTHSVHEPAAREMQDVVSPWLGAGWEQAFTITASSAFEPTGDDSSTMVLVRPGDSIQVLEQHDTGWTYCKNLTLEPECSSSGVGTCSGWVPNWVVKTKKSCKSVPKSKCEQDVKECRSDSKGAAIAA